ncbi:MAG: oligosaccharide flippase family protein [Coprobacillus cateniformis]|uniref:oligosaccharide flippase family protein n=1 Tax=Longibaculum muris TaxID=1796628 RepID=UPI003AB7FA92|nr:oligosaccharide flippase family protein [Coprobacillus cateniformis]
MEKNKIGKNAVILTISRMITLLISLVSAMLLSRFRTLTEYGTYSQLIIIVTLVVSVFSLGLPNSTNFFLARAEDKKERRDFLSVFYTLCTFLSIIMAITVPFITPLFEKYFNNPYIKEYTYFLAIYPWTQLTVSNISNVLVVYNKTLKLLIVNIANAMVAIVAIIVVQIFSLDFASYMMFFLCGEVLISVWIYAIVFRLEDFIKPKINIEWLKLILSYSIPIGFASLVSTINIEIDKLMIGNFFDTETMAIYTNSAKELPFYVFATALTAVILPQISIKLKKQDNLGAIELWSKSIELSYLVIAFCAMMCIVFAPQMITILYSEKYLCGVEVFRIYSFNLLLKTTYFGMILNASGKTKYVLYSSIFSLILNCVLNYSLFLVFGMIGPAIATVISISIIALFQLKYSAKILNVTLYRIFPWIKLLKITIINCIIGIFLFIIVSVFKIGTDKLSIVIAIIIGVIVLIIYFIYFKKDTFDLWRKLNRN